METMRLKLRAYFERNKISPHRAAKLCQRTGGGPARQFNIHPETVLVLSLLPVVNARHTDLLGHVARAQNRAELRLIAAKRDPATGPAAVGARSVLPRRREIDGNSLPECARSSRVYLRVGEKGEETAC